jgi:hypothetical protein
MYSAPGQFDPFDRITTGALGRVILAQGTFTALGTLTEDRFIPFNLYDMTPFHGDAAGTFAGLSTDRIALALRAAIARVQHILPITGWGSRLSCYISCRQCRNTHTDQ